MNHVKRKLVERELKKFTSRNFENPTTCRNLEQIRFYVKELCGKIEDLKRRFNYVPDYAYILLAQYNARQNSLIHVEFRKAYC